MAHQTGFRDTDAIHKRLDIGCILPRFLRGGRSRSPAKTRQIERVYPESILQRLDNRLQRLARSTPTMQEQYRPAFSPHGKMGIQVTDTNQHTSTALHPVLVFTIESQLAECLSRHQSVVKRDRAITKNLVGLVPFPRDHRSEEHTS